MGPCEVTAGDIKSDGEVEVLNPSSTSPPWQRRYAEHGNHAQPGRGYVPADRNKAQQNIIGVIPVDSIYTPVYKVNYTVENTGWAT